MIFLILKIEIRILENAFLMIKSDLLILENNRYFQTLENDFLILEIIF